MPRTARLRRKMKRARRRGGKFCPCCCQKGGDPTEERRLVAKARRRLDWAIIDEEVVEMCSYSHLINEEDACDHCEGQGEVMYDILHPLTCDVCGGTGKEPKGKQ